MENAKIWTKQIITNSVIAALFYFWQVRGVANAGNLLMFIVWTFAVTGFLAAVATPRQTMQEEAKNVPVALKVFSRTFTITLIAALVWFGHPVAATCYLISWVCLMAVGQPVKPESV